MPEKDPPRSENWKGCVLPVGGILGLAIIYFVIIMLNNKGLTANDQSAEGIQTATMTVDWMATADASLTLPPGNEILSTEEARTPGEQTDGMAFVRFIQGDVFRLSNGSLVRLSRQDSLSSSTNLTSNPNSGATLEFNDSSDSTSYLYLFFESNMTLIYDAAFNPQLSDGRLYLQTGLEEAAIHFPNHNHAMAILAGSADMDNPNRMLVEIVGTNIWLWCLSGDCTLENDEGGRTWLPPMTKSLYQSATSNLGDAIPITSDELWAWQVACSYSCLTGFATRPTPAPTITATPTITQTGLPALSPSATIDPTSTRIPPPTATPTITPVVYPPPLPYP
jgi:hypothetical protein